MYITLRKNIYYYRRRIPKNIANYCNNTRYIHRPLSKDPELAKKLAEHYNNIFNMIDASLKFGHDISPLIAKLEFKANITKQTDIYAQYLNHKNVSNTRIAKIKSHIAILKAMLPNDLNKLNMNVLDEIKDKLQKLPKMNIQKYRVMPINELLKTDVPSEFRQSINTVNDYIKMLNALLKFAYQREVLNKHYMVSLVKKKSSSREERYALSSDEIHFLMRESDKKLLPLYRLLYYSGMRLSEIYKCKITTDEGIKCFDLTTTTIMLKTKSSYRLIPVHEDIVNDVESLLEQARQIKPGYASKVTSKFFHTKGKTLYSLRHSFATQLVSKGIEPVILSELLGHAHKDMTMGRYVKGFPIKMLKIAIDTL